MKAIFALLVLAVAIDFQADAVNTCKISKGNKLITNSGQGAKMDHPCRYAAVKQRCGNNFIVVSPSNVYIDGRFFVNTIYLQLRNVNTGKMWGGFTTNKLAAKYINNAGPSPIKKNKGILHTGALFNFKKTKSDITVEAKDGSFSLTFGPYDPTGNKHRNADFRFTCNENDAPAAFPDQICGSADKQEVALEAERLGFKTGKQFKSEARDKTYFYHIFTNTDIDQTPNPRCAEVADTMQNVCPDDAKRVEAIEVCHSILYSKPHRRCATQYSCDIIDVYADCVKFVCSNYQDQAACDSVGESIDMCREYPGLSEKVGKCYNDLFIELIKPGRK